MEALGTNREGERGGPQHRPFVAVSHVSMPCFDVHIFQMPHISSWLPSWDGAPMLLQKDTEFAKAGKHSLVKKSILWFDILSDKVLQFHLRKTVGYLSDFIFCDPAGISLTRGLRATSVGA